MKSEALKEFRALFWCKRGNLSLRLPAYHDNRRALACRRIHSDFERGFIRAEVVHYSDLVNLGSWYAAKEKWVLRQEGKEYVVADGDCMLFKFNV